MRLNKKGVSPVIATIFLILLALTLTLIIYFWAKSFLLEKVQKDLGQGQVPIEESCKSVGFKVDAGINSIDVENTRNVPIYGIKLFEVSTSSKKNLFELVPGNEKDSLKPGKSKSFDYPSGSTVSIGKKVLAVPILLGATSSGENKKYICSSDYGILATVK